MSLTPPGKLGSLDGLDLLASRAGRVPGLATRFPLCGGHHCQNTKPPELPTRRASSAQKGRSAMTYDENTATSRGEQGEQQLWAVWHDRRWTARERAERGLADGAMHACIVHFTPHRDMAKLYESDKDLQVGEADGDGWAPELALLAASRPLAPEYARAERRETRLYIETSLRDALRQRAGWCRWCDCTGFVSVALGVERTELEL